MDVEDLKRVLEAFNRHDLDAIMSFFTDDCVFHMPRGPAPSGKGAVGKDAVRALLATRFEGLPDVHYGHDRHFVAGDRGVSEWLLIFDHQNRCTVLFWARQLLSVTRNLFCVSRAGQKNLKPGAAPGTACNRDVTTVAADNSLYCRES